KGLPRCVSDHSVVTIGEPREDWGPTPFWFHNNWLEDVEMMQLARDEWKQCKVTGSQGFVLSAKLKLSKEIF
ncbi:hypothetical protein Dsin_012022, partial [Dipteronia sinensis]